MKKSERLLISIISVLLAGAVWVILYAVSTHEPYVNPVCRDRFGHRIDCPTGE